MLSEGRGKRTAGVCVAGGRGGEGMGGRELAAPSPVTSFGGFTGSLRSAHTSARQPSLTPPPLPSSTGARHHNHCGTPHLRLLGAIHLHRAYAPVREGPALRSPLPASPHITGGAPRASPPSRIADDTWCFTPPACGLLGDTCGTHSAVGRGQHGDAGLRRDERGVV